MICNAHKRLVGLVRDRRYDGRPIKHIAGVDDEIDLSSHCRLEGRGIVGEEIVASTSSARARSHWQIEAEMAVGEEEDPDVG